MRRAFLKAGISVAAIRIAGIGLGFALTVALARFIGAEGVGYYAYATAIISLITVPISYGWSTVLLRATATARATGAWGEARGLAVWGARLAAVVAGAALAVGLAASYALEHPLAAPFIVALLAFVILFDQLSALRLALLRGLDRPVWGQLPETLVRPAAIIAVFIVLALATGGGSIQLAWLALATGAAGTFMIGWILLQKAAPEGLKSAKPEIELKHAGNRASAFALNSWLVLLNQQTDLLMLGLVGSAEDVGIYRVAVQIALLCGFGYTALNMVAMPKFATLAAEKDTAGLQRTASFTARVAFVSTLGICALAWLGSGTLIPAVFGEAFSASAGPLQFLLAYQLLNAFAGPAHGLLSMSGREWAIMPITAASVALNAGLCFVLIPAYGAEGAAMSSLAALSLWNAAIWFMSLKALDVDPSVIGKFKRS